MDKIKTILEFFKKEYGFFIDDFRLRNQKVFELLIGTILSQRSRDESTEKAVKRLFAVARTPEQLVKIPTKKMHSLIRISGPYKQKTKKIKETSKMILKKYGGKVPNTRGELMSLYGVGYKTADVVLMYGFNIPSIAIDTHCNRVPKRLGLVDRNTNVEKVKKKLEELFPKNRWYLINLGFVSFGKEICKPLNPICEKDKRNCPFSGFCKAYKTKDFSVK